jgi:hypothetical protein
MEEDEAGWSDSFSFKKHQPPEIGARRVIGKEKEQCGPLDNCISSQNNSFRSRQTPKTRKINCK